MAAPTALTFATCVSTAEKKMQIVQVLLSVCVWILVLIGTLATMGMVLVFMGVAWLANLLMQEVIIRRLQAVGATVSEQQFPAIHAAAQAVAQHFNYRDPIRIIVLDVSQTNAFALHFASKRVIVLYSHLLGAVMERPEELRMIIAHEMCHLALDSFWRRLLTIYRPAAFKAGRELSCDNAGLLAAGDLESAKTVIKKLCVGRELYSQVSEPALLDEARYIYSGFTGWLVKQYLTHPPAGARLQNVMTMAQAWQLPAQPAGVPPPL